MKKEIIEQMKKMGWQLTDWDGVWEHHKIYARNLAEGKETLDEFSVIETMGFVTDLMRAIDVIELAPEITDDMGWNDIATAYAKAYGEDKWTDLYWRAYNYDDNNDPDSGICFTMREKAIHEMLKVCNEKGAK